MAKRPNNWIMLIICLFLGWFGIDKLVWDKNAGGTAIVKLVLTVLVVGVFWNLYDIVMAALNRYTLVPFSKK